MQLAVQYLDNVLISMAISGSCMPYCLLKRHISPGQAAVIAAVIYRDTDVVSVFGNGSMQDALTVSACQAPLELANLSIHC